MPDQSVDLRALVAKTEPSVYCCPECGSFLDAPRVNPDDGEVGRKCSSCREWFSPAAASSHG